MMDPGFTARRLLNEADLKYNGSDDIIFGGNRGKRVIFTILKDFTLIRIFTILKPFHTFLKKLIFFDFADIRRI